jgi:hypothetical protein
MSKYIRQMQQQQQQNAQQQRFYRQQAAQTQEQFRRANQHAQQGRSGSRISAGTKSPTIFISYRHQDSVGVAQQIQIFLKGRFPRDHIFFDVASIDPGADFTAAMEKAIVESDVVFVVFGPKWLVDSDGQPVRDKEPDHARFEIEMAIRHKKPIVPLLVNGAVMPSPEMLSSKIASFSHLNGITVRSGDDFYADMDAVARIKEQYAPSPPPPSDTPDTGSEAYGGVLLIVSIIFAFFPLFPIATYFMARSRLKGTEESTRTGRGLLRASMIISGLALVLQVLLACGAVIAVVFTAQQFLPHS